MEVGLEDGFEPRGSLLEGFRLLGQDAGQRVMRVPGREYILCVFKRAWGAALFADQTVAYGPDTDGVSQLPQRLVECFPVPISPRSRHGISPQPTARPQNRSRCTALLTMGGSSMTSVALSCVKQRRGWDTRRPREAHSKWPIDLGDVSGRHEASSISSGRDNNNREPPSPILS